MKTTEDKTLSTADFAAAAEQRDREPARDIHEPQDQRSDAVRAEDRPGGGMPMDSSVQHAQDERLAPLFLPQIAEKFRARWDEVQIGFVDNPTEAVKKADELVAQVMKSLAETFADERANIEGQSDQSDTEHQRVAVRRYRSFFQRLLSL